MTTHTLSAPVFEDCNVVELRQYTLKPGQRETLISIFDTHFIEPQESAGMRVMGQFRDLGNPDKFVWMRGFSDMQSRRHGLETFYYGPVWAEHRNAANATMVDSDDVLLLQPAWARSGLRQPARTRATAAGSNPRAGRVLATIFHLHELPDPQLLSFAGIQLTGVLLERLALEVGWYATNPATNTFPKLPVREGETVLVSIARFADSQTFAAAAAAAGDIWSGELPTLQQWLAKPPQNILLEPTSRSLLGE